MASALYLFAGENASASGDTRIAWWDRADTPAGMISVPALVEKDWRSLRADYLSWIAQTGKAVADDFMISENLSVWWMSLMAEISPMKTRTPWLVFKLRAIEKYCEAEQVTDLTISGLDAQAAAVLKDWCRATGRNFTNRGNGDSTPVMGQRVGFLPHFLRGLIWLGRHWWQRVRLVRKATPRNTTGNRKPDTAIVTYFPNCDPTALAEGSFRSNYWQDLHGLLDEQESGCDWVWLYAPSADVSLQDAISHRDSCNKAGGHHRFYLLEEFASAATLFQVLRRYLSLACGAGEAIHRCGNTPFPGSQLALRPVLIEDWKNSFRGIIAAEAAWYATIFEEMGAGLPTPKNGLYVFENQPWEAALIVGWRTAGVAKIVAHQHEAVKPLNLRLFDDPAIYAETGTAARPQPDVLATGSDEAHTLLIEAGWPNNTVQTVESLRFRNAEARPATLPQKNLLVITGYLEPETRIMLRLVAEASRSGGLSGFESITLKPHPFLPVEEIIAGLEFNLPVAVTNNPLDQLWDRTAFAFAANSTAAIFDAIGAGIPGAICAPGDDFNLSPAFGREDVPVIGNAAALATAIENPINAKPMKFCEDKTLSRWRAILDATTAAASKIRQEA